MNGTPRVVAADHGTWRVDYTQHQSSFPRQVRIRSVSGDVDMTAALEQVEINTAIDREHDMVEQPWSKYPNESSPFNKNRDNFDRSIYVGEGKL